MILSHLLNSPMVNTRLLIAFSSLTWALLLFWPGDLFIESRKTYSVMAQILPELCWAMLFLLHGVVSLHVVYRDFCNRYSVCIDALLGCLLWTSSTIACFAAHWTGDLSAYVPPAAMSGEIWVMAFSWWYLVRHGAELSIRCDINVAKEGR